MKNTIDRQIAALWEELPAKWSHIAIDSDGTICAYTAEPVKTSGTWQPSEGTYRNLQQVVFDEVYTRPSAEHTAAEEIAYTAEQLRGMAEKEAAAGRHLNGRVLLTIAEGIEIAIKIQNEEQ